LSCYAFGRDFSFTHPIVSDSFRQDFIAELISATREIVSIGGSRAPSRDVYVAAAPPLFAIERGTLDPLS
jgi:hypothetical protein